MTAFAPHKLVIVQNRPTQFDEPFYAYLHEQVPEIDLSLYYTDTGQEGDQVEDHELGHAPRWDHVVPGKYRRYDVGGRSKRSVAEIAQSIGSQNPDHVILCGYYPHVLRTLAKRLKRQGVSIGLRTDNTLMHSSLGGVRGGLKRLLFPRFLGIYDAWHPVGTLASQYLETMSPLTRPQLRFPYASDNDWFEGMAKVAKQQKSDLLIRTGWEESDFIVLGIMKWHPREDPMTLVRAFTVLRATHTQSRLIMVGDGPLREEVRRACAELGRDAFLPGYLPYSELPNYYGWSDVFVHPAPNEPWGVSVNEAMAAGTATVVSEGVGAARDLIEPGISGEIFPIGKDKDLSEILDRLAANSSYRDSLIQNATRTVCEWSYAKTADSFRQFLDEFTIR